MTTLVEQRKVEALKLIIKREKLLDTLRSLTRGATDRGVLGALRRRSGRPTAAAAAAVAPSLPELPARSRRLAGLLRYLADVTLDTVEAIEHWQRMFVRPPPFIYSGGGGGPHEAKPVDYLLRVWSQLDFLDAVPLVRGIDPSSATPPGPETPVAHGAAAVAAAAVGAGLGFSFRRNPFAVAPADAAALAAPTLGTIAAGGSDPQRTRRLLRVRHAIGVLQEGERVAGVLERRERWCSWCGVLPNGVTSVVVCSRSKCRRWFCRTCVNENRRGGNAGAWDHIRHAKSWRCFLCDIIVSNRSRAQRHAEVRRTSARPGVLGRAGPLARSGDAAGSLPGITGGRGAGRSPEEGGAASCGAGAAGPSPTGQAGKQTTQGAAAAASPIAAAEGDGEAAAANRAALKMRKLRRDRLPHVRLDNHRATRRAAMDFLRSRAYNMQSHLVQQLHAFAFLCARASRAAAHVRAQCDAREWLEAEGKRALRRTALLHLVGEGDASALDLFELGEFSLEDGGGEEA